MKAIIAGTGIDKDKRFYSSMKAIETPFGSVEYAQIDGVVYLPRHCPGHTLLPHMINYRANVKALEMLGVDEVITVYAVGSITRRLSPGRIGLVRDFIDFTSGRKNTFSDTDSSIRHTPFVSPFDFPLMERVARAASDLSIPISYNKIVYITTNGPRLETPAEIEAFRILGADVVGMTLATEAALIHELGIKNASLAYSINWAAGLDAEGFSFLEDESIERIARTIMDIAIKALESSI